VQILASAKSSSTSVRSPGSAARSMPSVRAPCQEWVGICLPHAEPEPWAIDRLVSGQAQLSRIGREYETNSHSDKG
jgi:hypothetical protein